VETLSAGESVTAGILDDEAPRDGPVGASGSPAPRDPGWSARSRGREAGKGDLRPGISGSGAARTAELAVHPPVLNSALVHDPSAGVPSGTEERGDDPVASGVVPVPPGEPVVAAGVDEDEFAALRSPAAPFDVCDYLLVPGEGWRAAHPSREHRCTAVRPPLQLGAEKQRRLCLVGEHARCALFEEARKRRVGVLADAGLTEEAVANRRARPLVRSAPLVLEGGGAIRRPGELGPRAARAAQAAIGILAAVAIVAFVAARMLGQSDGQPATPGPGGVSAPSMEPSPIFAAETPVPPSPAATPFKTTPLPMTPEPSSEGGSLAPVTAVPSEAPTPILRTYRVKAGDTLVSIAARFDTTVKAIQELNAIEDARLIRVGQILKIP
jgi:hypothetical protein